MKKVGKFEVYSMEEVLDEALGPIGTPDRDLHERQVAEAVHAYRIGETIKRARLQQNLTQVWLRVCIGVKRARISRMEKGYNISLPTISRVFQALGVPTASLDLGAIGKIALW